MDRADNPLKYAPHTSSVVAANDWPHKYSREQAAFPAAALRWWKFWPPVGRIDNVWGDRNLFCTCPGLGAGRGDSGAGAAGDGGQAGGGGGMIGPADRFTREARE